MTRVSSNFTLFFKVFLPVFWLVFFGASTIGAFFIEEQYIGDVPIFMFRLGAIVFFILGVLTLYFTFWQWKRVEMDEEHLFVSDYFKNYRYTWDSVAHTKINDWVLFQTVVVTLKAKGAFGRKMTFMASHKNWKKFLEGKEELVRLQF